MAYPKPSSNMISIHFLSSAVGKATLFSRYRLVTGWILACFLGSSLSGCITTSSRLVYWNGTPEGKISECTASPFDANSQNLLLTCEFDNPTGFPVEVVISSAEGPGLKLVSATDFAEDVRVYKKNQGDLPFLEGLAIFMPRNSQTNPLPTMLVGGALVFAAKEAGEEARQAEGLQSVLYGLTGPMTIPAGSNLTRVVLLSLTPPDQMPKSLDLCFTKPSSGCTSIAIRPSVTAIRSRLWKLNRE